jgi:hypothetical protein
MSISFEWSRARPQQSAGDSLLGRGLGTVPGPVLRTSRTIRSSPALAAGWVLPRVAAGMH